MVDLMSCLKKLLFFDIPLLHYANLNSSIICCLFSGDIYIFGVSVSSKLFFEFIFFEDFEALVILSAILL